MAEPRLLVAETFKSIQGEGITMGYPAYFLRLTGCNLLCGGKDTDKDGNLHGEAEWRCDTIEVWKEGTKQTIEEVIERLGGDQFLEDLNNGCRLIVTGGEPMLQQTGLKRLFKILKVECEFMPMIEVETNGTIPPELEITQYIHQWNVSPKLKNSGMSWNKRHDERAMYYFADNSDAIFKFVILDQSDWLEVLQEWMVTYDISGERVWLMPGAETRQALIENSQEVADLCRRFNINFSSRLQLINWDKTTGV